MKILFRVDSSKLIGSGHLMRCLTLAQRYRKEGHRVTFVCRNLEGNLAGIVKEQGFQLYVLPAVSKDDTLTGYDKWLTVSQERDAAESVALMQKMGKADRLVVDSYAIDETWEKIVRPYTNEIFVIDDLANRKHDCDVLLDQNFYLNKEDRYTKLVPEHCNLLLGPKYALLREEFYQAKKKMKTRDGKLHNILVFYGGVDATAVDFLEELDNPIYKIASFENVDIPLIKKVAATGKPIIASTGMASLAELDDLVTAAKENGCKDFTLLKCTSSYPASPKGTNIMTIPHMKKLFNCNVGLSDHTLGFGAAVASIALGATVIEKHFTLSRADGGVDSAFSLEPEEMKLLVRECNTAFEALGHVSYGITEQEKKSLQFRRSLYIVEDMKAGDKITKENMRCIRPGLGLAPKYYGMLLGKHVTRDIERGTPVDWNIIG